MNHRQPTLFQLKNPKSILLVLFLSFCLFVVVRVTFFDSLKQTGATEGDFTPRTARETAENTLERVKRELSVLNAVLPKQDSLYGHIFNNENMEQVNYYAQVAKQSWIKTVCEIGFAAGHSTIIYLESNPNIKVYSFDDFGKPHIANYSLNYITARYPGRLLLTKGDSTQTVPQFARQNPHIKCDLISVDGAHDGQYPWKDLVNMRKMAASRNVVLADDYLEVKDLPHPNVKYFKAVNDAWQKAGEVEMIRTIETKASKSVFRGYGKGWAYGTYIIEE